MYLSNFAGSYCLASVCSPVPSGYFSTPVTTAFLFAGNLFADQASAVTGTAANGGLSLAIAVGGTCSISTVGCAAGKWTTIIHTITNDYIANTNNVFYEHQGHTV